MSTTANILRSARGAYFLPIDLASARARGVDAVVAKPYRLDRLRKAVAGTG